MTEARPVDEGVTLLHPGDERMRRERRERIATAVLGSMATAAGTRWDASGPVGGGAYARRAVEWADALIAELDQ